MHDVEGEDVDGEQGQRQGEQVEVPVVPLAHTVAHPGTVVIEAVCGEETKKGSRDINMWNVDFIRKQTIFEIKGNVKNTPVSVF